MNSNPPAPQNMRSFYTIWLGEVISVIGSTLTMFGLGVYLFMKTGQATPFTLTIFFGNLPGLIVTPIAGAIADRMDRRLIMIVADFGSAVGTLAAMLLLFNNMLEPWHVYIIAMWNSLCGAFQEPAYMASVPMLVPRHQLGRANGMLQSGQAISMLIGPVLAGALYGLIGLQGLVVIDFLTFFAAIAALMIVRIPRPEKSAETLAAEGSIWKEVAYGWSYIAARAGLLGLLLYFALVNFLLNVAAVLTGPLTLAFATPAVYGIVQTAGGVGMLAGSIAMGAWGGPKHNRVLAIIGFIGLGAVGLLLMGVYPSAWVIGGGMFLLLFAVPLASGTSAVIWQTKIDPALQGRTFATRSTISRALMPVANLISGPIADNIFEPLMRSGTPLSMQIGGVIGTGAGRGSALMFVCAGLLLIGATALVALNPRIRRMEQELPDFTPVAAANEAPVGAVPEAEPAR